MIQLARLTSICEILEKNDFFLSDQASYLDTITAEPRERRHIEDFAFIGDIGAFAYFCILDRGRDATSDTEHFDQWQ